MADALFERHNKPINQFPYIQLENKNHNYMLHYHEEMEIIFVQYGDVVVRLGAEEIRTSGGDICIVMPGEVHSIRSETDSNDYIIKVNISPSVENINPEKIRLLNSKISPGNENYSVFADVIDKIKKEYTEKNLGYEFEICSETNRFIAAVFRLLPHTKLDSTKNINLLNIINKYLEKNYAEEIMLDTIAKECHFSKCYFAHEFKKLTGMTFINYLSVFRLKKAVALLKNSDMKMTEIAEFSGFSNIRSFNRTFKKHFGKSPVEYRQQIAENK